jgi:hypothetical protein
MMMLISSTLAVLCAYFITSCLNTDGDSNKPVSIDEIKEFNHSQTLMTFDGYRVDLSCLSQSSLADSYLLVKGIVDESTGLTHAMKVLNTHVSKEHCENQRSGSVEISITDSSRDEQSVTEKNCFTGEHASYLAEYSLSKDSGLTTIHRIINEFSSEADCLSKLNQRL